MIGQVLQQLDICFYGLRRKIAVCSMGGDDFILIIEAPSFTSEFELQYRQLKENLESRINQAILSLQLYKPLTIHMGYTEIKYYPDVHIEKLTYKAIKAAGFAAKQYAHAQEHARWRIIRQIIEQKQIRTVFQPIFSLSTGTVLGYEALSRGPAGFGYESPATL